MSLQLLGVLEVIYAGYGMEIRHRFDDASPPCTRAVVGYSLRADLCQRRQGFIYLRSNRWTARDTSVDHLEIVLLECHEVCQRIGVSLFNEAEGRRVQRKPRLPPQVQASANFPALSINSRFTCLLQTHSKLTHHGIRYGRATALAISSARRRL